MNNDKRLFVGGIAYKTTEEDLQAAFAQAGTVVSARIIKERETGRSKGFGFVEMETEEMAQAAIDMWNGKDLEGATFRSEWERTNESVDVVAVNVPLQKERI